MIEHNVWLNFPQEEIPEKLRYWVDRWEEMIDNFTRNSYGFRLSTPHVLLRAVSDEIANNDLRSAETRQLFKLELSRFLREDSVVRSHLAIEIEALIRHFDARRLLYLEELCVGALPFFVDGEYFRLTHGQLVTLLLDSPWADNDGLEIGRLSNALIVELLLRDYHHKTVREMPRDLFSVNATFRNGHPSTTFPHGIDWADFQREGNFDTEGYKDAISTVMQDLTIRKRLLCLRNYFEREPRTGTVIFPVSGFKTESSRTIGPVTIYPPNRRTLVRREANSSPGTELKEELFRRDPKTNPTNIAVALSFVDAKAAPEQGASVAGKALDLLRLYYNAKTPLSLDWDNNIVLDEHGWIRRSSSAVTEQDPWYTDQHSTNLEPYWDHLKVELDSGVSFCFEKTPGHEPLREKLPVCLNWYRKGQEAKSLEDSIINNWIVLERCFAFPHREQDSRWTLRDRGNEGKFAMISEFMPVKEALSFMYDYAWELHEYLRKLLHSSYHSLATGIVRCLSLPPELVSKCGLALNVEITHLDDFLPRLGEIAENIENRLVREKVEVVQRFYTDPLFAQSYICRKFEQTRDEIVLIYRFRNSIVHQGHFDRRLLEPFAVRASELARHAVGLLAHAFMMDRCATVESIFMNAKVEYDRTLGRLEKNLPVDFVTVAPWGTYPRKTSRDKTIPTSW